MSVKHYGIYIAFPPGVDLRHEGLGRYLAAFLAGAAERSGRRFVLLCPSWSKTHLEQLLLSEGVAPDGFEMLAPARVPVVLRLHMRYVAWRRRARSPSLIKRFIDRLGAAREHVLRHFEQRLVSLQSGFAVLALLPEVLLAVAVALLLSPLLVAAGSVKLARLVGRRLRARSAPLWPLLQRVTSGLLAPKDDALMLRLYRQLERVEAQRMLALIEDRADIRAWYCPTAFWPAFNEIPAPRLMCVPDVVLGDFAVGFSGVGGDRVLQAFQQVERAVHGAEHFVTYSEAVRRDTLLARYAVPPSQVRVIRHAVNDLSRWVQIHGGADAAEMSRNHCRALLQRALRKATHSSYISGFANLDVRFIFYASQFRPHKNVIGLLKAYLHLLRKRYIGHKLIMTGHPDSYSMIRAFIVDHGLENDVICVHGLTLEELAACYKLADLAVNPSLSEGGFPFTFSEALSVDTPVLMARIAVSEEVITDPQLQALTFFDPHSWQHMAERIEWALSHLDPLRAMQKPLHVALAQRTWADVVDEHVVQLERISQLPAQRGAP